MKHTMKNKQLSSRNVDLILSGGNVTGTFTEGYYYNEERMYVDEADTIFEFCKWIDDEVGGCGPINIQELWSSFNNPNTEKSKETISHWKKRFAQLRSYTKN